MTLVDEWTPPGCAVAGGKTIFLGFWIHFGSPWPVFVEIKLFNSQAMQDEERNALRTGDAI